MNAELNTAFQPSITKACARCRSRKVKCDLKVPRCTACIRHNEECDITQCVAYPYSVIQKLQDEIRDLKARLQEATINAVRPLPEGNTFLPTAIQSSREEQVSWSLDKEAQEVGNLAIGGFNRHSENKYIGSASGSTFARIFFKQLSLPSSLGKELRFDALERCPSEQTAALPSRTVANLLFTEYIARVHIWWPFVNLPNLRRSFQSIYANPRKCSASDKFIVFAVLALSSSECQDDPRYTNLMDLNESEAYFQTALRFFHGFHDHPRDLFGIQAVLLLALWMANSDISSHCNDLWHMSRYLMSAAIEAGFHRQNAEWGFSAEEMEIRNRTWWCIYNMERHVAVITGRVLSVRDHAVHALQPTNCGFDILSPLEAAAAPIFHKHNVFLCRLMTRLRQISGQVLESVYIGRGPDGKALATSFQDICAASDNCRRRLELWRQELSEANIKPSREYSELKIEYCLLQLLLNRPSPTFMVPSSPMIAVCSKSVSSVVKHWNSIESQYGISAVCRCFRQLHATVIVGLAGLYCDWSETRASLRDTVPAQTVPSAFRHRENTAATLSLLRKGLNRWRMPSLNKYYELLELVSNKVYAATSTGSQVTHGPSTLIDPYDVLSTGSLSYEREAGLLFSGAGDIDMYMNQVSSVFDEEMKSRDETLAAWYDAVMEEIRPLQRV
ncbi:fungal-specific transcription factor domain-containing protein [Stachybotrys elegans]|uniref:Fungal-specific transcription factor domain-containing protein n=1 Tax=Stachybotrys elegans TaxID=80388 RepID=A0A8K0SQH3_9HYPO|nr:fungal-specific transcription factor domain-containing protein [Stachybotrys elegans]